MGIKKRVLKKFTTLLPILDERALRFWAATEARDLGRGGVTILHEVTGLARSTISSGLKEIGTRGRKKRNDKTLKGTTRLRKIGAGAKTLTEKNPALLEALDLLVNPATRGDPMSPLRWTSKSLEKLATALNDQGFKISSRTVGTILKQQGYSMQANRKTKEGNDHPDRDAQFEYINEKTKRFLSQGQPVISVDAKKKELIGDFANKGKEREPSGKPTETNGHDFPDDELGKVAPYGVYDINNNVGLVNLGINHDTAELAVASIEGWWNDMGKEMYKESATTELLIHADCGGSNGSRSRLWKQKLQDFSNKSGLKISVSHFPPGTSKWNKIEHRMFSFISINWRGKPLVTREVVVNLIANTTTREGLKIKCTLDTIKYEKGIKIDDDAMKKLNISRSEFHGEWNYTIAPQVP